MGRRNDFEFTDNSQQIKSELGKAAERGMIKALNIVETNVKVLTPVDTGGTRDHISHTMKTRRYEIIGKVGSPHKHAIYLEKGTGEFAENGAGRKGGWVYRTPDGRYVFTRGMRPQPFMRPGFKNSVSQIEAAIGHEIGVTFGGG